MPYIKDSDRKQLELGGAMEASFITKTPGELNYCLTMFVLRYFAANGENYQAINDVLGALEGAKQEFYRRVAAPYEDKKIKENGDVYAG